jgi:REP element-mobilizing transposase RayT
VKRFVNPPPGARSRRLGGHDYRGGAYFVTTNTKKRVPLFGTVEKGRMYLSTYGKIVAEEWHRTGDLRDEMSLDVFIVMPDHVHGLLWICHSDEESEQKESRSDCPPQDEKPGTSGREMHLATSLELPSGLEKRRAGTLSTIMGCFKAAVTRRINEKRDTPGATVWQSSFHDHIVRNRKELHRIRRYIRTNPQQWSRPD